METIKIFIVLKREGIEEEVNFVIPRETAEEISRLISVKDDVGLAVQFESLVDVKGEIHNINLDEVESFEFRE